MRLAWESAHTNIDVVKLKAKRTWDGLARFLLPNEPQTIIWDHVQVVNGIP